VKLLHALTLYTELIQANGCDGASIASVLRLFAKAVGGDCGFRSTVTGRFG